MGLYTGSLIVQAGDLALAGTGFYYHPGYETPEALLRALGEARDPETIIAEMGGSFALCLCDGHRDEFRLWRSVVGQGVSFYKVTPRRLVAGNRGRFVSCLGDGTATPNYDPAGAGRLAVVGQCMTDLTPFAGVQHMPPHSVLHAAATGRYEIKKIDGAFDGFGYGDAEPSEADFDEAARLFLDSVASFKRDGVTISLTLSGGKDSRLIAAAAAAAGMKATAYLGRNWSDHPDLLLGDRLGRLLGLDIQHGGMIDQEDVLPSRAEVRIDVGLVDQLRRWDARLVAPMYSPYLSQQGFKLHNYATEEEITSAQLAGDAGEMLKGGWAQRIFVGDGPFDRQTAKEFLQRYMQNNIDLFSDLILDNSAWRRHLMTLLYGPAASSGECASCSKIVR